MSKARIENYFPVRLAALGVAFSHEVSPSGHVSGSPTSFILYPTMRSDRAQKCAIGAISAFVSVGILSVQLLAGFKSGTTFSGDGFPVTGVIATGPLTEAGQAYVNKVKAEYGLSTDAEARTKALEIIKNLCNAIETVKKRNKTVGECRENEGQWQALCRVQS